MTPRNDFLQTTFGLAGRRALVTGSSQGIGLALALGLAKAGASIVLNGRDTAKVERARQDILATCPEADVQALGFDVTEHETVREAIDGFELAQGPIDILVNNAGMQHRSPLEDFPAERFEALLQTNIASVFNVGQAVARHMIGRGSGKIINICSVQTALARPGIAPYTATKGAVANLTKGMATDWARYGCNATPLPRATSKRRSTPPSWQIPSSPPGWRNARPPDAGARWRNWSAPACSCPPTRRAS